MSCAEIIELPVPKRVCGNCENALFGPGGVYCRVFQEDIWNEAVAVECEEFEPT